MSPPPLKIAAAVATFRRDEELTRLLSTLAGSTLPFDGGVFVADNAASEGTRSICKDATVPVTWLPRASNGGPGPAWNTAVEAALTDPGVTHVLVLDDDVVPPEQTTAVLAHAMGTSAAVAAPLLADAQGKVWAFPEPRDRTARQVIRRLTQPDDFRTVFGVEPHDLCWATGACLLYARDAFAAGGFREDFWMLGEDLEFSMRTASRHGGVFTAAVVVPHLPPAAPSARSSPASRGKFLSLLQNLSWLASRSPHSAHLWRYLPANFLRYLRTEGISAGNLRDALDAFRLGALLGRPAGHPSGHDLRRRAGLRLAPSPRR